MTKNNKINTFQYSILIMFLILSSFSGIGFHNIVKISKVDCYISIIISYFLGLIILGLTLYISNYEPDKNIHEKIYCLFGKVLGGIINLIINIVVIIISVVLIYGICNFIVSQYLSETPILIIGLMLEIVVIYTVSKGIETIVRSNIIFLVIALSLSALSFISLFPQIDTSNLKPFLEHGLSNPIKGGIVITLTNIVPIIAILIIPKNRIINYPKVPKYLLFTYTLSYIIMLLITIKTISVLGINLTQIYQHPEYIVLKKISILNFFDKVENIIFIKWILSSFSSLTILVYFLSNSIKKGTTKKLLPAIVVAIIITISHLFFKNNTIFTNFIESIYPYINLFLFIVLIIVVLNIFVRKRLTSTEQS